MKALVVAASIILGVGSTGSQGLSPEEIAAAIEQGRAGKTVQKKCSASGDNGVDIVVEGPIGRIMGAAREARREHPGFTVADVTPALSGPWLTVAARRDPTLKAPFAEYVTPGSPFDRVYRTDLVLRSKPSGSKAPILLKPVGPIVYHRENAPGFRAVYAENGAKVPTNTARYLPFPGADMSASFDLPAFRAIPPGDVEAVVFMTDTGERRCTLSDKERRAIR